MTLYELLLFVHILAAAIWFGSGLLLHVLAHRAKGDDASVERLFHDTAALSTGLFIPSSLVVLVAGVLLVVAVMALKPTGDDVVVLTVMALVMVAGTAYLVTRVTARSPIGEAAG